MSDAMISREDAERDVILMARRMALLYYHFARVLGDELGEDEALRILKRVIEEYGRDCGRRVREFIIGKGLPLSLENYGKAPDLPGLGWKRGTTVAPSGERRPVVHYCPMAEMWKELGAAEIGRTYCRVDQAKYRAYNPGIVCVHTKNVLDGDECCEFGFESPPAGV
ncbi:MAG: L-2-amino-thiazoline-4-carboxylic acid hydrolase [Ignavibacteriales bacterium]